MPLLHKMSTGVTVPDGGQDVLYSDTIVTYQDVWTDNSTGANVRRVGDDQSVTFTYTYAAMYAAMGQFADKFGWALSLKAGGKAGIPLVPKARSTSLSA
ncbi:hypothetical protein ACFYU9_16810 [Streptomyces sp. NPDC004327]|uniref:hypothetical protein n=1 Tax=Streptomyces sp. NPDC004327 TaxID=3364699 RepID=UPI0036A34342